MVANVSLAPPFSLYSHFQLSFPTYFNIVREVLLFIASARCLHPSSPISSYRRLAEEERMISHVAILGATWSCLMNSICHQAIEKRCRSILIDPRVSSVSANQNRSHCCSLQLDLHSPAIDIINSNLDLYLFYRSLTNFFTSSRQQCTQLSLPRDISIGMYHEEMLSSWKTKVLHIQLPPPFITYSNSVRELLLFNASARCLHPPENSRFL